MVSNLYTRRIPLVSVGCRAMSASERAYRHVKEQVLDGSIPGGELICENEIAEQLGMSRTPVRAAFGQLESEGLLRLYPKRGALVVPVSAQETEAVMETRWVIERYAIERVVERPGDVPQQLARGRRRPDRPRGHRLRRRRPRLPPRARRRHRQLDPAHALRLTARPPAPHGPRDRALTRPSPAKRHRAPRAGRSPRRRRRRPRVQRPAHPPRRRTRSDPRPSSRVCGGRTRPRATRRTAARPASRPTRGSTGEPSP